RILGQRLQGSVAAHLRLCLPVVLSKLAPRIGGGVALRHAQAEEIQIPQHELALGLALLGSLAQPQRRRGLVGLSPEAAVNNEADAGLGARIIAMGKRAPQPHGGSKIAAVEGRQPGAEILFGRARDCRRYRERAPSGCKITWKELHWPGSPAETPR